MKILSWEELQGADSAAAEGVGPLAATVGVFDGLHLGHMELVKAVLAREDLVKGIVTFRESPKKARSPSSFYGDLFTLDQKLEKLDSLGLELCVLIDFSGDFSKLAGRKFLSLLRDRSDLRFLAVGANFRCGYKLDTDAEGIREYYKGLGVETLVIEPVAWKGSSLSSSRIRNAVLEGRLEDVRAMLGRDFELDIRLSRFAREGASLRVESGREQVRPPEGRYEAELDCGGASLRVSARLLAGTWSIEPPTESATLIEGGLRSCAEGGLRPYAEGGARPTALRLVKLVSRE
jgi:FAD synthase